MAVSNGDVVVIIGTGGMGAACARRLGPGRTLVLADVVVASRHELATELAALGYEVIEADADVSDRASVDALAAVAASHGFLRTVVHTAGLSPTMASGERVLAVDLVGTAHVLAGFLPHVGAGSVMVCIASMAGHMFPMDAALEVALGSVPADELIATMPADAAADPGVAYAMAKRANMARVRAAAIPYGAVGARVVSISPGIIATGMGRQELDAQPVMHDMLAASPIQRIGTPDDIAAAVEWLASPAASFITGTDLRVDGGVTAQVTMQPPTL